MVLLGCCSIVDKRIVQGSIDRARVVENRVSRYSVRCVGIIVLPVLKPRSFICCIVGRYQPLHCVEILIPVSRRCEIVRLFAAVVILPRIASRPREWIAAVVPAMRLGNDHRIVHVGAQRTVLRYGIELIVPLVDVGITIAQNNEVLVRIGNARVVAEQLRAKQYARRKIGSRDSFLVSPAWSRAVPARSAVKITHDLGNGEELDYADVDVVATLAGFFEQCVHECGRGVALGRRFIDHEHDVVRLFLGFGRRFGRRLTLELNPHGRVVVAVEVRGSPGELPTRRPGSRGVVARCRFFALIREQLRHGVERALAVVFDLNLEDLRS